MLWNVNFGEVDGDDVIVGQSWFIRCVPIQLFMIDGFVVDTTMIAR